jgi:hypothetical protein
MFSKVENTAFANTHGCNSSGRPSNMALPQVTFEPMFILRPTNLVFGDAIGMT